MTKDFSNLEFINDGLTRRDTKDFKQTLIDFQRTHSVRFYRKGNLLKEFPSAHKATIDEEEINLFFGYNEFILDYIRKYANQQNFREAGRTELMYALVKENFSTPGNPGKTTVEFNIGEDGSIGVIEEFKMPEKLAHQDPNGDQEPVIYTSDKSIATIRLVTRISQKDDETIRHYPISFEIIPGDSQDSINICNMLFNKPQLSYLKKYVRNADTLLSAKSTQPIHSVRRRVLNIISNLLNAIISTIRNCWNALSTKITTSSSSISSAKSVPQLPPLTSSRVLQGDDGTKPAGSPVKLTTSFRTKTTVFLPSGGVDHAESSSTAAPASSNDDDDLDKKPSHIKSS